MPYKQLLKTKTISSFRPKFTEETALNRKYQEFFTSNLSPNKEKLKIPQIKQTTITKKENTQNANTSLSSKQKKLLDLFPSYKPTQSTKTTPFYEGSSLGYTFKSSTTTKEMKFNELESNIFHDPSKTQENIIKRNKSAKIRQNYLKQIDNEEEEIRKKTFHASKKYEKIHKSK